MRLLAHATAHPPEHIAIFQLPVGGRDAEVLTPEDCTSHDALLYIHGGGFVAGEPSNYRPLTWRLADRLDVPVYACNYRLAPEHACPAALDDVTDAYLDLIGKRDRVAVMGDSAGGNLALALAVRARDMGLRPPSCVVAISPPADLARELRSIAGNAEHDPLFRRHVFESIRDAYLGDHDPMDWRASPARADLSGLPPVLLQCSEHEMLSDYSRATARKLRRAGVDVSLHMWPELFHVWHVAAGIVPEADEAIDEAVGFIARHLSEGPLDPPSVHPPPASWPELRRAYA
jgi:acetyl esterase/lipase